MSTPATVPIDEAAARRVLLVQAFDNGPADNPLWTPEDARWATRLARQTAPADAAPVRFIDERARHALQRLQPRERSVTRLLNQRLWRWWWLLLALLVGFALGVLAEFFDTQQRINLLAPQVWLLVGWNLLLYLSLLLPVPQRLSQRLGQRLAGRVSGKGVLLQFRAAWARLVAPVMLQRAALLLHAAAVALALGLIAGMYLRGLVLDYRAGWQSTFLEPSQVQALLATLLAPAVALTGIGVPDAAALAALRIGPDVPATASAAPWIHLFAAALLLFVVLPRVLLMLVTAARAAYRARHLAVPLSDPYFQKLLREQQGRAARVQVLAHGSAPSPHVLTCIQALLANALGDDVQVHGAPATAYGQEESAATLKPEAATTLRLALVELGATPEDDSHGAFVAGLRRAAPALPLVVLADEAAFKRRFHGMPGRLQDRRKAWADWAARQPVGLVCADLAQPDPEAAERDLQTALQAGAAA